jgi:para-nitrobenzyl esterase
MTDSKSKNRNFRWLSQSLVILAIAMFTTVSHAKTPETLVQLASGKISGTEKEQGLRVFKGIPYAVPPVGENRWQSARPHPGWAGAMDASSFGPQCMQPARKGRSSAKQSEDCLTLNVWTKAKAGEKLPVMVWIHGGAFKYGSSASPFYNGASFARSGVVFVSMNYRLGRFGFFAHPLINGPEANSDGVPNFGLTDQVQALRWVQENVEKFGGNPADVTIFGESAGAVSVSYLLSENKAEGLFHKAIIESGGGYKIAPYAWQNRGRQKSLAEQGTDWANAKAGAQAVTAASLRSLSAKDVLDDAGGKPAGVSPAVDGVTVTADIAQQFAAGKQSKIPVIIGSNSFEGSLMDTFGLKPKMILWAVWKRKKQAAKAYDKKARALSDRDYAYELFGDAYFVAPSRGLARHMSRDNQNIWVYGFDFRKTDKVGVSGGSRHGQEIPFVFGNPKSAPGLFRGTASAQEIEQLSANMHAAWVTFAKTGNPNGPDMAGWPKFQSGSDEATMVFDNAGQHLVTNYKQEQLDLQDVLYQQRLAKAKVKQ